MSYEVVAAWSAWPFSSSTSKKEKREEQLERVVKWVRNLGPVSTRKLVMHKKITVPKDVTEAVRANPGFFVSTDGWKKLCDTATRGSSLPGAKERCYGSGTNEWGNTLRSLLLESAKLRMDAAKETRKAMHDRLSIEKK